MNGLLDVAERAAYSDWLCFVHFLAALRAESPWLRAGPAEFHAAYPAALGVLKEAGAPASFVQEYYPSPSSGRCRVLGGRLAEAFSYGLLGASGSMLVLRISGAVMKKSEQEAGDLWPFYLRAAEAFRVRLAKIG